MPLSSLQLHELLVNTAPDDKGTVAASVLCLNFHPETTCRIEYEMSGDSVRRMIASVTIDVDIIDRAQEVAEFLLACGRDDDEFGPDIDLVFITIRNFLTVRSEA